MPKFAHGSPGKPLAYTLSDASYDSATYRPAKEGEKVHAEFHGYGSHEALQRGLKRNYHHETFDDSGKSTIKKVPKKEGESKLAQKYSTGRLNSDKEDIWEPYDLSVRKKD